LSFLLFLDSRLPKLDEKKNKNKNKNENKNENENLGLSGYLDCRKL